MLKNEIENKFETIFNEKPQLMVRSSGRINLIGEHTDYNGGFVLPAAIDKGIYFAFGKRKDKECHFFAYDLNEKFTTNLDDLQKTETASWANYLMGVLDEIKKALPNTDFQGINVVFGADLPSGGGLSSSAAIENAMGFGLNTLYDLGLSRLDLVSISQLAENNFVGMKCGIMDMFASMMGVENQFIRIDCRDLSYEYFPFEAPDLCLVLCNTMVKHALVNSEYNTRRAECEEGVSVLKRFYPNIKTLRDVAFKVLKKHKNEFRPVVFQRCKYVIEEIERVELACKALQNQDFAKVGKLMYATHEGLSKEYEVSCPELDFLADFAKKNPNVLGARMMGGGFGGCTINLIKADAVDDFIATAKAAYLQKYQKEMVYYVTKPSNGTELI